MQLMGRLFVKYLFQHSTLSPEPSTKRLENGTLVSPPLEDLAPFLPREELAQNMFIPMVPEV